MKPRAETDRELIDEQIQYYEQRALEYDATSAPDDDPLAHEDELLIQALQAFRAQGKVLEVACGTGTWTKRLLDHSDQITALDASPRMLELNRQKVTDPHVNYVLADIFDWVPDDRYDVVFFANWLSHVPPTRFEAFWNLVRAALADDGRVFFVDEAEDAWRHEEMLAEEFVKDDEVSLVRRTLQDGRAFRVVKVFWNPSDLQARLGALGWNVSVVRTGALYWGEGC